MYMVIMIIVGGIMTLQSYLAIKIIIGALIQVWVASTVYTLVIPSWANNG